MSNGGLTTHSSYPRGTNVESGRPNSLSNEYSYGQSLYPAPPLSWLAPLWSFLCGVAASGAWAWTGSRFLRLLSGLLLVGPLLGLAWATSTQTSWRESPMDDPPGNVPQKPIPALPYTLSGSASHRLGGRLSAALAWWQQVEPRLGRPLLQLLGSTVFSLAVAAQLGQQSLALTVAGLAIAYANRIVSVSVPLFTAWLLGHAVYNTLRPASLFAAASFSVAFYGYSSLNQELGTGVKALTWPVVSQAAAVASLIAVMQPVAAAIVALLGTCPLLLAPLLETERGREQYFRAVQSQLAIGMFVTALALGYTP
jgi:hypothetical protein